MIEFKRASDVMVFTCPAFKIEVLADSERIELNREAINSQSDSLERISDAFKILDMMLEHKSRQTNAVKADFDIYDARKRFREFMEKEGF